MTVVLADGRMFFWLWILQQPTVWRLLPTKPNRTHIPRRWLCLTIAADVKDRDGIVVVDRFCLVQRPHIIVVHDLIKLRRVVCAPIPPHIRALSKGVTEARNILSWSINPRDFPPGGEKLML